MKQDCNEGTNVMQSIESPDGMTPRFHVLDGILSKRKPLRTFEGSVNLI